MGRMAAGFANPAIEAGLAELDGGTIEFQTAASAEVATCTFSNPAISGSASAGVATCAAITKDDAAAGGGPITKAVFKTAGATAIADATAAESAAEITVDNDTPGAGVDFYVTSLTFAFPVVSL